MRRNARRSKPLHAAMKAVTGSGSRGFGRAVALLALLAAVGAAVWGVCAGVTRLRAMWIEQCVVRDVARQVRIRATPHVGEGVVRELFALTNGCNLATMDFDAVRTDVLRRHPIIKDITVTRRLPDRLEISLTERKPIARIVSGEDRRKADRHLPWNVADAEGMVFSFPKKDTGGLPMVIVPGSLPSRGERLAGHPLSALRLVSLCESAGVADQEFSEISTESQIYMKITTRSYRKINLSWKIVDPPDDSEQPNLRRILSNYVNWTKTHLTPDRISLWIVDLVSIQMEESKL